MSGQGQSYEKDDRWTTVDHYSFSHLHPESSNTSPSNDILTHALNNSKKQGLPDIAVSPSQGKFLKLQAQIAKAQNILEMGTLGGYSTIWLASSSPKAKIVSVEIDPHHAHVAQDNIKYAGYADQVEVKVGPGVDVLKEVADEVKNEKRRKFDLVFIDADKENNWNYVNAALDLSNSGAVIIVDNVVRKGQLAKAGTGDPKIEGARTVVENIGKDERLDGVVVQTVGEKNYDGYVVAVVK